MENINFIEGINIIAKYLPEKEKEKFGIQVGHDQLWFGSEEWVRDENDIQKSEKIKIKYY